MTERAKVSLYVPRFVAASWKQHLERAPLNVSKCQQTWEGACLWAAQALEEGSAEIDLPHQHGKGVHVSSLGQLPLLEKRPGAGGDRAWEGTQNLIPCLRPDCAYTEPHARPAGSPPDTPASISQLYSVHGSVQAKLKTCLIASAGWHVEAQNLSSLQLHLSLCSRRVKGCCISCKTLTRGHWQSVCKHCSTYTSPYFLSAR